MTLLLDVLEVITRCAARWILLAHVTEPARKLREAFAVGALAKPVHGKMFGLRECGARENCDAGLEKNHVGEGEGRTAASR